MADPSLAETPIYDCRYKNYGTQVALEKGSVVVHIREMRNVRYSQWVPASSSREVAPKPHNRNFISEGLTLTMEEFRDLQLVMDAGTQALEKKEPYFASLGDRGRRLTVDSYKNIWVISNLLLTS